MSDEVKLLPCWEGPAYEYGVTWGPESMAPCPFCAHDMSCVTWIANARDSLQEMEAPVCICGAQGPMYPTREEAIAAWNTRAIEATRPTDMGVRDAE